MSASGWVGDVGFTIANNAGRLDDAAAKTGGTLGALVGGVGANKVIGKAVPGALPGAVGEAGAEAKPLSQEVSAGAAKEALGAGAAEEAAGKAVAGEATRAGASKAVLTAEDCNAAGIKRLFEGLPKKNRRVAHVESEAEITEMWSQLKKTGAPIKEEPNGALVMTLPDETIITYYKSKTDTTSTIMFNFPNEESAVKIHLKAQ